MEDTIEICSGCGKMPRPIDKMQGYFICSRCGNRSTIMVNAEDYERTAMELDEKFHAKLMKFKAAEVKKVEPEIEFGNPGKARKKAKKKAKAKPKKAKKPKRAAKPKKTKAKKAAKKKTVKKKPAKKAKKAKKKRKR
jgi:hypothetical protein